MNHHKTPKLVRAGERLVQSARELPARVEAGHQTPSRSKPSAVSRLAVGRIPSDPNGGDSGAYNQPLRWGAGFGAEPTSFTLTSPNDPDAALKREVERLRARGHTELADTIERGARARRGR